MSGPMDLRARTRAREQEKEAGQLAQLAEDEDFRSVMSSVEGRRFMWWLLGKTGLYETSFTGNSTTFFNEGKRNIGLLLINRINDVCPEQYANMVRDAKLEREKPDG